jgi:hypothetical protein
VTLDEAVVVFAEARAEAPPLPPLRRTMLSTAAVTGTFGTGARDRIVHVDDATTAFLPGFALQGGTSTVN